MTVVSKTSRSVPPVSSDGRHSTRASTLQRKRRKQLLIQRQQSFLDIQTTVLIATISPLDAAIRANPSTEAEENYINEQIESIAQLVHSISTKTRETALSSAVAPPYADAMAKHTLPVVEVLEQCRGALMDVEDVDAVLAGLAAYFSDIARRPDPPGLPTVRAFQRAQGEVVLRWLRERWAEPR